MASEHRVGAQASALGRAHRRRWWLSSAALLAFGCNLDNEGFDLPEGQVAFPIALALSQDGDADAGTDPSTLFVVNSNFDLAYNAASVQAFDLNELHEVLRVHECRQRLSDTELIPDGGLPDASLAEGGFADDQTQFDDASFAGMDAGGGLDAGLDGGLLDASAADGAVGVDAEAPDAGVLEGGLAEGGLPDGATLDAGTADAAATDAGFDGGALEAGVADGGVFPLDPDWNAPSVYGTKSGVLCEDNQPTACCYQRDRISRSFRVEGSEGEETITLLADEVPIASYATGVAMSPDGTRLYVPVRSDNRLIFLDVEENGALSCGGEEGECERGPDRNSTDRDPDARFAPSPTAVVAGSLRQLGLASDDTFVVTAHERGEVGLFVEMGGRPVLQDLLPGASNRLRTNSLTLSQTGTEDAGLGAGTIYVTSNDSQDIVRVAVRELAGEDARPSLYITTPIQILGLSPTFVLRDVQVDPRDPARVYALTGGSQQAVAFLNLNPAFTAQALTFDSIAVGNGPSKLRLARLGEGDQERMLLFASNYDAGSIYVIDVDSRKLTAVIRGFNGPYDMVIDAGRNLMYVGDFRSSVVRVVDIEGITDRTKPPPRIIATLGELRFSGGPT